MEPDNGALCQHCYFSTPSPQLRVRVLSIPIPIEHPVLGKCNMCQATVWTRPPLLMGKYEGQRIHGGMICSTCQHPFREHPLADEYPNSGIVRLCGGGLIKL